MKKTIFAVMMTVALFGCDEANKTVDSAQEAATEAAESVQETASEAMDTVEETASDAMDSASDAMDNVEEAASDAMDSAQDAASDMADSMTDSFDYDQFAATSPQAKSFSDSIQAAMDVDFSDPQAVDSVTNRVANAYKCYVESTSESEAQSTLSSILSSLSNGDVKSLIQTAIDNAALITQCVM